MKADEYALSKDTDLGTSSSFWSIVLGFSGLGFKIQGLGSGFRVSGVGFGWFKGYVVVPDEEWVQVSFYSSLTGVLRKLFSLL